jgi:hypothetical protein
MKTILLLIALIAPASELLASTILSESVVSGGSSSGVLAYYESWTQTGSYTNVAITGTLTRVGFASDAMAYLLNQVGPGTTAANVLFSGPISGANFFTGLTLGPGTYYLVVGSPSNGNVSITFAPNVTLTLDAGVTEGPTGIVNTNSSVASFVPASAFSTDFNGPHIIATITGTPATLSSVPEPSTVVLIGAGLAALLFTRRALL